MFLANAKDKTIQQQELSACISLPMRKKGKFELEAHIMLAVIKIMTDVNNVFCTPYLSDKKPTNIWHTPKPATKMLSVHCVSITDIWK